MLRAQRLSASHCSSGVRMPCHSRLCLHPRRPTLMASSDPTSSASTSSSDEVPIGCSRYTVKLKKPLGVVLEQDTKTLAITVAELKPDGSAAKCGEISVGDQLVAVSGVTYSSTDEYGGTEVRKGQEIVRLRVIGESMKTVSAAIGSHPGHIPVTMEFQKCDTAPAQ